VIAADLLYVKALAVGTARRVSEVNESNMLRIYYDGLCLLFQLFEALFEII